MRVMSDKEQKILAAGLQDWAAGTLRYEKEIERLRTDRNAIIEECARVAELIFAADGFKERSLAYEIAAAIRAQKGKP